MSDMWLGVYLRMDIKNTPHAHNMLTILGSTINIIWGRGDLCDLSSEHENLHFEIFIWTP
jgi:hypothetical protein